MSHNLFRIDANKIELEADDICVFSVMRNEIKRLPYWLRYYREQGVRQFFIVDNDSTDGTTEFLLQQQDCILFQTKDSYAGSRCGVDWLNAMLDEYGVGRWCMVVDVDELFVFSKSIGTRLPDIIAAMEREGAEGAFTLMIDMYSPSSLTKVQYQPGTSFLTQCNAFDAKAYYSLPVAECPYVNIVGGVRQRLFYPEFSRRAFRDRLGWKLAAILKKIPVLADKQWVKNMAFSKPPVISKVPFVKWTKDRAHISGAHTVTPLKLFSARCALLHFKFFEDFHVKALEEIKRGQHYDGAREYRRYFSFFDKNPDFTFGSADTVIYRDAATLEELYFITPVGANPTDIKELS